MTRVPGTQAMPSRRLAAIMFTDLVGYSALAHRDEALAIEMLELHRAWIREILPQHGGKEIETVGDAFLIEFAGALAAIECATAIQQRFSEHNALAAPERRMELRIGIHLGDVEHKDGKVVGDGVNIASRIHGMADPGGICVSDTVHDVVRNRADLHFVSLGTPSLKNISTSLELFRVATGAGPPSRRMPALLVRRYAVPAALVAVVVAAGAFGIWRLGGQPPPSIPSIAVLPFENLSAEPDSAFFTDGLHDTVIGHLARIRDLKVISRTSVMGYRGDSDLRKIAQALGVNHIVEGSVQRSGSRLRVAAQLIDTVTDSHVWSTEYDRDLADVFAVQADIAQQIAAAVRTELTPDARARMQVVPTRNMRAYDLYLKALQTNRLEPWDRGKVSQAIEALEQAVRLDSEFALGYALLSYSYDLLFWRWESTDAVLAKCREAAETALRLDPNLPEAQVARARYLYHGHRRYDDASVILERVLVAAPGSADAHELLGHILARRGRPEESLARTSAAADLDPRNYQLLGVYGDRLARNRQFAEAERVLERALEVAPNPASVRLLVAQVHFQASGNTEALRKAVDELSSRAPGDCDVARSRAFLERTGGRHRAAMEAVKNCIRDRIPVIGGSGLVPKELDHAEFLRFAGDFERASAEARVAARRLRQQLAQRDHAQTRILLAMALALAGDGDGAVRESQAALASPETAVDALLHVEIWTQTAWVLALLRRDDAALDALQRALELPWGVNAYEAKADPAWQPFLAHPRFQKLLDEHAPGKV